MNPLTLFRRPEYLHRPSQIFRRLRRVFSPPAAIETVRLPWGRDLRVHTAETIGAGIYSYGIFDLPVCEAITRLLDPGELALEIGANLGQMASLMRSCVGASGRVIAFEPHPELFAELCANMEPVGGDATWSPADLHAIALSRAPGEALLDVGPNWAANRGMSRLVENATDSARTVRVPLTTLDAALPASLPIGLAKMDVEGHELAVLEGARELLASHRLRDFVFEDFGAPPSPTMQLLSAAGYTLLRLRAGLFGPRLVPAAAPGPEHPHDPARDYLATLDPDRAHARFRARGWRVLSSQ